MLLCAFVCVCLVSLRPFCWICNHVICLLRRRQTAPVKIDGGILYPFYDAVEANISQKATGLFYVKFIVIDFSINECVIQFSLSLSVMFLYVCARSCVLRVFMHSLFFFLTLIVVVPLLQCVCVCV